MLCVCHVSPHALEPLLLPGNISLSSPSQLSLLPDPLLKPFLGCPASLQLLLLVFFLLLPPVPTYISFQHATVLNAQQPSAAHLSCLVLVEYNFQLGLRILSGIAEDLGQADHPFCGHSSLLWPTRSPSEKVKAQLGWLCTHSPVLLRMHRVDKTLQLLQHLLRPH